METEKIKTTKNHLQQRNLNIDFYPEKVIKSIYKDIKFD